MLIAVLIDWKPKRKKQQARGKKPEIPYYLYRQNDTKLNVRQILSNQMYQVFLKGEATLLTVMNKLNFDK
jgi:hypothetical protein